MARLPAERSDAINELERVIGEAVRLQQLSDVPVGAFLSGGIDSSTVVALMQTQSSRSIRTFSIGFRHAGYDEAAHAAKVARYLGTDHTELYVTEAEASSVIPALPEIYDEPFADSSQIPTLLVAQLARGSVTVSLSGDGGDELFGGYPRYRRTMRLWRWIDLLPWFVRNRLGGAIRSVPPQAWEWLERAATHIVGGQSQRSEFGRRLDRLGEAMGVRSAPELYRYVMSHWTDPASLVLGGQERIDIYSAGDDLVDRMPLDQQCMYWDSVAYLPDDILVKLDRAAMAVGLETRVPLLDHRVVELGWRMPREVSWAHAGSKRVLREVLHRYVPRELVDRPKMGFGVPIGDWLRGDLRDWAESLLDMSRLQAEGFLAPKAVRRSWSEHLAGRGKGQHLLWDVLMFQAWLERWGSGSTAASADANRVPVVLA